MSLASLKEFMELELTFLILGGTLVPPDLATLFGHRVDEHLHVGNTLRLPLSLIPAWYKGLWPDRTQIDGLARIDSLWDPDAVNFAASHPRQSTTIYKITRREFLRAVLDGQIFQES